MSELAFGTVSHATLNAKPRRPLSTPTLAEIIQIAHMSYLCTLLVSLDFG